LRLSRAEADLFFKLMWNLQVYVNQQRQVLPQVKSVEDYARLSLSEKVQVRDALWENPGLIDTYVKDNPDRLSTDELDIVRKWRRFVPGTFQIFRQLKKHAIFIGEDSRVYGVLSLYDSLEEMFYGRPWPIMIETVLLPFRGKIVHDGMFKGYEIYFGGGIRAALKEEYMAARQNGSIITTLEAELAGPSRRARKRPDKNWGSAVDDLVKATQKMKGGPAVQRSAFALLRASARLTHAAVHHGDDLDKLWSLEVQVRKALSRLQRALDSADG